MTGDNSYIEKLSLRVKIYVVNYRKVVNIGTPRGCQPGEAPGCLMKKKIAHCVGVDVKTTEF